DRARAASKPVRLEAIGRGPLQDLAVHDGATWLDERLASPAGETGIADTGFGAEAREALKLRRMWLARRKLLGEEGRLGAAALDELRGREMRRVGTGLEGELGRPYAASH